MLTIDSWAHMCTQAVLFARMEQLGSAPSILRIVLQRFRNTWTRDAMSRSLKQMHVGHGQDGIDHSALLNLQLSTAMLLSGPFW
jgi:hypothetical protein